MIPHLPSELKDEIINHLYNDRSALTACSLASSDFLSSTRHHLFSGVIVRSFELCAFLELLDMPWCSMAPAIVRMTIDGEKGPTVHGLNSHGVHVPRNGTRLISRLQGVEKIRFSFLSSKIFSSSLWQLLRDLKGVRELEVYKMTIETPIPFFQYICSLPNLTALSVTKTSMTRAPLDMSKLHPVMDLCIPLLDVSKSSYALLDWLLAQDTIPRIQTFCINLSSSPTEMLATSHYSEVIGSSVRNLHVRLPAKIQDCTKYIFFVFA
jgi:hypothetical protein